LNTLEDEKNHFGMDVQMITEMQSDLSKIVEEMEKQLGLPPYTEGDHSLKNKNCTASVDERRFAM
jgi:hypothetical protein